MAETMIDIMKRRVSVRTYSADPVPPETLDRLAAALEKNSPSLFGSEPRFLLTDPRESRFGEAAGLSTYGVVKNPYAFIVGAVRKGPRCLTDFGYAMERNILEAAALGLGTCWLGGTFSRSAFARAAGLREGELLPAVSPVGLPAGKKSLVDGFLHFAAGSRHRRPWQDLFCLGSPAEPLFPEAAGGCAEALECVRIAPSAQNKQPWRVVKDRSGDVFHFYYVPGAGGGEVRFAEIDIGIALCHFELAAGVLGQAGGWAEKSGRPAAEKEGWTYILSWESR